MESSKTSSIGKIAVIFLALFIICILLAYNASATLTDGLISYWSLDNAYNGPAQNVQDSLYINNGTNDTAYPGQTTCLVNQCYDFDNGSGSRITIAENAKMDIPAGKNFAYSFAVNRATRTTLQDTVFAYRDGAGVGTWAVFENTGVAHELSLDIFNGANSCQIDYVNDTVGKWVHYVYVCDLESTNRCTLYSNGTNVSSVACTADPDWSTAGGQWAIGALGDFDGYHFDGLIDEVGFWNRTLNNTEVYHLYTNWSAGFGYDWGVATTTEITFNAIDDFNASNINSFSINLTWVNGSQDTYNTINGTIRLINVSDSDTIINVTYWNITDYYNLELYNKAITANATNTITGELYQAVATLTATEKITNNSLSGVTFYIGSKSGTTFNLSAGTHSVTAVKAGYYNLTRSITVPALSNASYNLEGMYNSIAQFYAYNAITNASVSSFTVYLDIGENLTTTNGTASTGIINNTNYTFNISGSGFTSRYNISYTVDEATEIVNTSLYTFNSVRVNIFNESSMGYLLQSVTIHTISNLTTFSNVTSTGFILIDLLTPNYYELRFESVGFNPRSIFLTVTNDSTQNLSVYMTENTTTELQVIEVLNTANQPLEGAVVWLQKEKLNQTPQWVTIQEAQTDYAGKTSVFVERDVTVFYRFAVIYGGVARPIEPSGNLFTGKTTFIPGITETIQLIVDLEEDPEDFISDALAIAVNCSLTNLTAFCTIIDGRNSITGAVMRIEASYINESLNYESIANVTFSGSSGILTYNITEVNNSVWRIRTYITYETSEALVWETIKSFDADVIIEKNTGLFYAALLLIVVAALTVSLGPLASGLISFSILIPISYLKIISMPVGIITGLLALVIIFFFRTRKLDE